MPAETMLDLLASRYEERGSAPAILAPGREAISYAALRDGIDRAGDLLAALGLGRGSRIAVALPDGPDAAVAMLAALTWATCTPLNPLLDFDACLATFEQLRIDALIAAPDEGGPIIAAARAARLFVVRLSAAGRGSAELFTLRAESGRVPVVRTRPSSDDVALVMHTSGTTSKPKAVPITHRALVWAATLRPLGFDDRCLCITPLYTRSGLGYGVLAPLAAGASTVITPGFDATRFWEWLDAFCPTYFSANPTVHAAIIDAWLDRKPVLPTSLRFVRSSNNAMPASLQEKLESVLQVPVIQGYGSTEGGVIAHDSPLPGRRRAGSVGIPLGAEVMIQGERGEALPAGTDGEILVRGPGVMRGYENDQEANRLAFQGDWFRTGDLGHFDADGYLFVTGRLDDLINRGGFKVAPAEVDAMFIRHPAVHDAATVGVPHPSLGQDVVTAVILRQGESVTVQELRGYALQNITPFKVPSSVVLVSEFPRNALGKVQRHALADSLRERMRADFVPPRDAEEELVAGVFASLLSLPRVGALDNFFDLGGDSLRGIQAISRLGAQTGIEMEPRVLFEAPTVEEFAQRLRRAMDGSPSK